MYYIKKSLFVLSILILLPIFLISSSSKSSTKQSIKKNNSKEKSYISKEYFNKNLKCSSSCGVAIKGWYNAKNYCTKLNSVLASKIQIKETIKDRVDICLDCNYWTSGEVIPKKITKNQKKKVYIYLNFEDHFLDYSVDNTYIATCVSK